MPPDEESAQDRRAARRRRAHTCRDLDATPFPDEDMRARLWAAHLPPETPTAGDFDFDFAALARRFPLSGGYIRNSALRAAFLAAQEEQPLSQSYLLRAIQLEYRELGKLSTTGRME